MKKHLPKAILLLAVVDLLAGIAGTYEAYRGTDLSRVPPPAGKRLSSASFDDSSRASATLVADLLCLWR